MAEYICLFNKDTLIIKPPKKSPLLLRMAVLVFSMVCSVYICLVCLRQINNKAKTNSIRVIEGPFHDNEIEVSEMLYEHYPNPKTFSRAECEGNPVRSRRENFSTIVQNLDKVYNLDWLSSAAKNQCSAAVGFKWMLNQGYWDVLELLACFGLWSGLSFCQYLPFVKMFFLARSKGESGLMEHHKEVLEYFNRRGVFAIFLFRRNLLRRMVSDLANSYDRRAKLLNGTHKAHVHSAEEAEKLSEYKPEINSTSLITDLKNAELTVAKALEYFNSTSHIILYYEDIFKNRTKLKDVQQFLGLPEKELTSRHVKIHQGSLREHIKNWDDVNKTLTGTAFEHFLNSDY
ncbi:hypothetical protein FEM48_Zijuj08G0114400 [Ziziphus jujuba var. spinosa]|uniref:Sulfotransferase n=1 Tax=Ziziphus jujuba var. spinosa TaxID=714518 RepID=A0A978UYT9_ZIZJJ|nr:hypothetical protein FEM48_Zijuj08G0114400 [Ziziphus jujuba var. spinosa]